MHEFDLIARYFRPLAHKTFALDLKDDAALIDIPEGHSLVVTKDLISAGIHFIGDEDPALIARKLLRVNLSDLAAKGAKPYVYFLGLALPKNTDENWIKQFAAGLQADQTEFDITLAGGDTTATNGTLTLSLTAFGLVKKGEALLRSTAKPGDLVFMSGTLGDSYLGLQLLTKPSPSMGEGGERTRAGEGAANTEFLIQRYQLPQPRLTLGQLLHGTASSCMDISDGLIQDLGHIHGATIHTEKLPFSAPAKAMLAEHPELLAALLGGGDDYELLFTVPPAAHGKITQIEKQSGVKLTEIGVITTGSNVIALLPGGTPLAIPHSGYRHF